MTPRARSLSADERRASLIEATLPLLLEHGRGVTTRQIAAAAGVAEGTIFRVFDSKEDLVDQALAKAFDIEPFVGDLGRIEPDQPLRDLVSDIVTLFQIRFRSVFSLMHAVGMVGPPQVGDQHHEHRARGEQVLNTLLGPHADELAVPVDEFAHTLRLLTFAGSHSKLADGRTLTTEQIVTTLCDGLLKGDS